MCGDDDVACTYIFLSDHNLYRSTFRNDLCEIAQPHRLVAALVWLHAQILEHFRIEPSARAQLRQVILQAFDSCCDVCFQCCEVIWVIAGCVLRWRLLLLARRLTTLFKKA